VRRGRRTGTLTTGGREAALGHKVVLFEGEPNHKITYFFSRPSWLHSRDKEGTCAISRLEQVEN
jgi:hypothetical protein